MRTVLIGLILAAVAAGQQPAITNAKLQAASAKDGLEQAVRAAAGKQSGAAWIGYAVAKIPGDGQSCCFSDSGRGCGLEGQRGVVAAKPAGPVQLEGPSHVAVLMRYEGGQLGKIRAFTIDCPLDAGGLPVHWLTDAAAAQSVAMLSKYADSAEETGKKLADASVHAIAQHAGPAADTAMEKFATSGATEHVRKQALFWLANSRGKRGFEVVSRVGREDSSDKVREHAIFALTQSREAGAIPAIIRIAKEDKSARVRGQALFWVAQSASKTASGTITEAIERDPDTEVKKKAVFALTQLPKEQGTPLLIQVARTNANPAVKKQAMFWLGQSKDPAALKFFEEVLTRSSR